MGRVVNPDSAGKIRTRLSKEIVLALRELMRQQEADDHSRDLAAFIALALMEIHDTVDQSVIAWEKRGYWVKADHFRLEWEWAASLSNKMRSAVISEDWITVATTSAQVAQKMMKVQVPVRHRLGEPWTGAWHHLKQEIKA